jgi:arginine exporter protein ArgO
MSYSCTVTAARPAQFGVDDARRIWTPPARAPYSRTTARERLMIDWLALGIYTLVMSITPGPNNIMLLASGARFGFRRTLPHLLGVSAGFTAQTVAVCAGLSAVTERLPGLQAWLTWAGVGFMAWLAYKLLRSGPKTKGCLG